MLYIICYRVFTYIHMCVYIYIYIYHRLCTHMLHVATIGCRRYSQGLYILISHVYTYVYTYRGYRLYTRGKAFPLIIAILFIVNIAILLLVIIATLLIVIIAIVGLPGPRGVSPPVLVRRAAPGLTMYIYIYIHVCVYIYIY